ncbi:asparagine synthase (glutamine-hydrolyzing) [Galdieria sulphuraria]|uniref:asparagine synthase (glutamine-hydrolyzing) n=1 Tax=Galdieria sulphuraria TaxID=130081 RepID=M2Y0P9_GALSU|nr:asparagine synthase (glutamine-hydrolyzing) [Galdieria sulphuraria]EME29503.1 asparagine synthase (glutamine-hydrolysing) [Galdieria sulphuraria]|eukprot:XP_005706023.1 asparagine synthase (glutamine-hydrolysing) [Galdieria sulphuraria]
MCGILAVLGSSLPVEQLRELVKSCTRKLYHRGPDEEQYFISEDGWCGLGFARLKIVDPEHGAQPMFNDEKTVWSVTNGELYNHEEIREKELDRMPLHSHSDCEIVIPLYEKYIASQLYDHDIQYFYNLLRGVFASCVVDLKRGFFMAGRDPIGVRALFYGTSKDGAVWFASEAKSIMDVCDYVTAFIPGTFVKGYRGREQDFSFTRYYEPVFWNDHWMPVSPVDYQLLHDTFVLSCKRRLMSDVPVGVFISGGLDSSLVASVAKRLLGPHYEFHSFACGLEGAPDVAAAQRVADFLKTKHHVLTFTVEEGIKALDDVIYHLETYDVTTVRASTPMYLLSGLCKKYVKVVLSGEGADEIFGGYLYFHNAPDEVAFHQETVRRVKLLYTADVLRGDRATAAQSLELRVPFLDRDFLDVAMSIHPREKVTCKNRIEKYIIRYAFSKEFCGEVYLPDDILWRQKEQFSDGVGYSWIDGLKAYCEKAVTDQDMQNAAQRFPHDTPTTKEAYVYRDIFERHFGKSRAVQGLRESIARWVPMWSDSTDPSGRAQKFHVAAYSNGGE